MTPKNESRSMTRSAPRMHLVACLLALLLGEACGSKGTDAPAPPPPTPPPPQNVLKEVFVAPGGLPGNPGTLSAPTTLEGAQALVRQTPRTAPGILRVTLRGGRYLRSSTFALTSVDSGSASNPVEYAAYAGETPRLAGGVTLDPQALRLADSTDPNWARLDSTARPFIRVADLGAYRTVLGSLASRIAGNGEVNRAMEAFADGRPLTLARYPKAVDAEAVNLAPPATLRVTGTLTPDATGDYAYKGTDALGRPYYQMLKAGDVWSIAASAASADWYVSNRRDLGGSGPSAAWGSWETFAGPAGTFPPFSGASGKAFIAPADGTRPMPGFMLIRSTNGTTLITAPEARMSRWHADEAMYFGEGYYAWAASHCALSAIDPVAGTLQLASTPLYGLREGHPFFLYNLLEELTDPGDFFIDRVNARLYLRPPSDALPGELLLSTLATPVLSLRGVNHVTWSGVSFEAAQGNLVDAQTCSQVTFSHCRFLNAGGWGLLLGGTGNHVDGCELAYLGKGGLWACGGSRPTLTDSGTVVENCDIHHFSRLFWTYQPGIQLTSIGYTPFNDDCSGLTVQHNEIHHAPHQAIAYQGNNHTFRYNLIHHVCQWTNDAGAVYTQRDWASQGNLFQFNLIRQGGGPFGTWTPALYLDTGGSGLTIEGNIFYQAGPTLAIQLTPFYEFCEPDILAMVAEKQDLLVDHGGKNHDYNFYRFAGVAMVGDKGTHVDEAAPVVPASQIYSYAENQTLGDVVATVAASDDIGVTGYQIVGGTGQGNARPISGTGPHSGAVLQDLELSLSRRALSSRAKRPGMRLLRTARANRGSDASNRSDRQSRQQNAPARQRKQNQSDAGEQVRFERSKALELVVWLATHRDRPTRTRARTALWELDVRDATFATVIAGMWPVPADNEANIAWVRDYYEATALLSEAGGYINFMSGDDQDRIRANYRGNYDGLVETKRKYDPDNLFHVNQNIGP